MDGGGAMWVGGEAMQIVAERRSRFVLESGEADWGHSKRREMTPSFRYVRKECGELADAGVDGGEAVAAGGAEVAEQAELIEDIGRSGEDIGRRRIVVKLAEKCDKAVDKGGVGVGEKTEVDVIVEGGSYPNCRYTAMDPVSIGALGGRDDGAAFGAIEDEGEALLGIVDGREVFEELGVASRER